MVETVAQKKNQEALKHILPCEDLLYTNQSAQRTEKSQNENNSQKLCPKHQNRITLFLYKGNKNIICSYLLQREGHQRF